MKIYYRLSVFIYLVLFILSIVILVQSSHLDPVYCPCPPSNKTSSCEQVKCKMSQYKLWHCNKTAKLKYGYIARYHSVNWYDLLWKGWMLQSYWSPSSLHCALSVEIWSTRSDIHAQIYIAWESSPGIASCIKWGEAKTKPICIQQAYKHTNYGFKAHLCYWMPCRKSVGSGYFSCLVSMTEYYIICLHSSRELEIAHILVLTGVKEF